MSKKRSSKATAASAPTGDLEALARAAIKRVKPGHRLGLGTGHAASAFLRVLGASGISVVGVPTEYPQLLVMTSAFIMVSMAISWVLPRA